MKLGKRQRERVRSIVLRDIERANDYYEQKVEPILRERYDVYEASKDYYEKKFPKLSKQTDLVSYDMWSTVQWAIPPIMSAFFGGDEIVNIVGREEEDAKSGEQMKKLIQYQILKQNTGFVTFKHWCEDAMALELGVPLRAPRSRSPVSRST